MSARVEPSQPRRRPHTTSLTSPTVIQVLHPSPTKPVALCWSPSGSYLALATQGGPVYVFYILPSSGGNLRVNPIRVFRSHTADVLHLTFSSTDFLLTASLDRNVRLWHANTAVCLRRLQHPESVTTAAFHPTDESLLVTGACDGVARLWRPASHACIAAAPLNTVITTATFSPTGHDALIGTYDGRVHVLPTDPQTSDNPVSDPIVWLPAAELPLRQRSQRRTRRRSTQPKISGLCIDIKNRGVVVCAADARIHELREDQASTLEFKDVTHFRTHARKESSAQFAISLSPDGRFLIMDAVGNSIRIVDLSVGREADALAKATGKRKDKDLITNLDLMQVVEVGKVSCAAFATNAAVMTAKPNATKENMLIAVGLEDGSLRILETEVKRRK